MGASSGHRWLTFERERVNILLVLAAAICVRLPHLISPYVINPDAIAYTMSAKALAQGRWMEGFQLSHASIYPVLISVLGPLVGDWIWAARALTALFGILTIVPIYYVSRKLVGWPWSAIPPLLYSLSPTLTHYSMDVIREPISWFLLLGAIWTIFKGWESRGAIWYFLAGILLFLATTNRLDGVIALACILAWKAGRLVSERGLLRSGKEIFLVLFPFLLASVVLLAFFPGPLKRHDLLELGTYGRQVQGAFSATGGLDEAKVKQVLEGISYGRLRHFFSSAWENRHLLILWDLLKHWIGAAHPLLFIASVLGLISWRRWKDDPRWWLLFLLSLIWFVVAYVRISGAFAISKRHLGPLVICGYMFAPLGLFSAKEWISQRRWIHLSKVSLILFLCLLALSTLPMTLKPQRQEKIVRRLAGEWIKSQGLEAPIVATENQIIAFYAEGVWLPLKDLVEGKASFGVDFLVVEDGSFSFDLLSEKLEERGMKAERLERLEHSGRTLTVYRVIQKGP
jgi:hypothetical protein